MMVEEVRQVYYLTHFLRFLLITVVYAGDPRHYWSTNVGCGRSMLHVLIVCAISKVIADIVMYLLLQTLHEIAVLLLGQKKGTADFGELDKPFTSRYACVEPVLWPD